MSSARQIREGEATRRRILDFIARHQAEHGWAPTVGEIAAEVGHASKSSVHVHLQRLRDEGELVLGGGPRMIRLTGGHIELRPAPMPPSRLMVQDGRLQPGAR